MSNSMEDVFGPVISAYTREQAHADGVLIDVSDSESAHLFKFPISITQALSAALSRGKGNEAQVFNARLWDVLYMGYLAAKRATADADVFYTVKVGNRILRVWGNCGPDDNGTPCMTFGFPEDR